MLAAKSYEQLLQENVDLQTRLDEAEETLHAIRKGELDALIVPTQKGIQVFTLETADQQYRLMVEQMQQGAVTISRDRIVLYCNRCFANILGFSIDAIISQPVDHYLVSEETEPFKSFLRTAESTSALSREFNLQNVNRQIVPVYISANILLLDQTQVICLLFTDLRERKQSEKQSINLAIEKQRTKLLADFVRDTSHDLRTPISVILAGLGNIEHLQDETKRKEKLQVVERYVLYLNDVLEELQFMASLDSIIELSLRKGKINTVIEDAVLFFGKQAKEKSIFISVKLAPDLPLIRFDADSLYRAMSELIKNAIRFTPYGGQIQIRSSIMNHSQLILEVVDNGSGIDSHSLPHIFERLFKADATRNVTGGAGLGLSIVKRIVELHNGSIEVESIPNEKTIFRIVLPEISSS